MAVHYDNVGRAAGKMIKSGGAGFSVTADVTTTVGVGTAGKAGLAATSGSSAEAQADLVVN